MSEKQKLKERFNNAMKPFNKVYLNKYGYSYDDNRTINRSFETSESLINTVVSDYAIWLKFINPSYIKKPSPDTKNLEHIRSYYCNERLKFMKALHKYYLYTLRDLISNKLGCEPDNIIEKMSSMAKEYTEEQAFKKFEDNKVIINILEEKYDIHNKIYKFLY